MKQSIKNVIFTIVLTMSAMELFAQGVIVYKKDGTSEKYHYAAIDSIVSYSDKDKFNGGTITGDILDIFAELQYDELVYVEGGTFLMGAQSTTSPSYDWQGIQTSESYNYDSDAETDEGPVHEVTLDSYYIGKYEVTQALWEYVMTYSGTTANGTTLYAITDPWLGSNPSSKYGVGDNYPAYYVSYDDIVDIFLPRLNAITGKNFRLPTEAEWEYAARGGQKNEYTRTHTLLATTVEAAGTYYKYSGSNTIDNVAWYTSNSGSTTHPVGGKVPNELGLYDMSGNVWEWCSDWYSSSYYSSSPTTNPTGPATGSLRVLRGGGWDYDAAGCRVSIRFNGAPGRRGSLNGFRLSRSE